MFAQEKLYRVLCVSSKAVGSGSTVYVQELSDHSLECLLKSSLIRV